MQLDFDDENKKDDNREQKRKEFSPRRWRTWTRPVFPLQLLEQCPRSLGFKHRIGFSLGLKHGIGFSLQFKHGIGFSSLRLKQGIGSGPRQI